MSNLRENGDSLVPRLSQMRKRIYACNIQGRGGSKIPDLKLRTADSDFIVLCETNTKPGDENSINLNSKAVAISEVENKALAFGTVVWLVCQITGTPPWPVHTTGP